MKRLRVGLLVSDIRDEYDCLLTSGIMEEAENQDVDLIIFPGHCLTPHYEDEEKMRIEYQHNSMFGYATKETVDVLIILYSSICLRCSQETINAFLSMYKDIPTIIVSGNVDGYTCLNFDNVNGLYNAISDFIEKRGLKKICCVAGLMGGYDPNSRYMTYRRAMEDHGLVVEDKMVEFGDLTKYCAPQVENLLANNPDVEAIVFGNDQMAAGGYEVLKKHNIAIGKDVLVLGFDDSPSSLMLVPTLSTIKIDLIGMGKRSVLEAIDFYKNHEEKVITFEANAVWRGSTGDLNLNSIKDIIDKEQATISISSAEKELIEKFVNNISHFDSEEEIELFVQKLVNYFYSFHGREEKRSDDARKIIAKVTKDILNKGNADDSDFAGILNKVAEIGYDSGYLFALEEPVMYEQPAHVTDFSNPNVYLLKSYFDENGVVSVDLEKQRMTISQIFDNDFINKDKRHTFMVNKIFNNKEVLGVFISEPKSMLLKFHSPLVSEICTAYKTLYLLYEHKTLYAYLNETLKSTREKNKALTALSKTDPMTGLPNRRSLNDFFDYHKNNIDSRGKKGIVGMIDLNNLKLINDIYNHEEGDFAIAKAGSILKNSLRGPDIVSRTGGDEFVLIIADHGEVTLDKVHDRIHANFERYNRNSGKPYVLSASVGLIEFEWSYDVELEKLLVDADELMYEEKRRKKNGTDTQER